MGMARHVLGLVRAAVAPGVKPEKRERARRILRRMAREHLHPDDLRQQRIRPAEGELFPSHWRVRGVELGGSGVVVVVLSSEADAVPIITALRAGGMAPDVLMVKDGESQAGGGVQCVAAPGDWGLAARLIALANSGRLDPYKRLVLVSQDSSALAKHVDAALNALTTDLGCGLVVQTRPLEPTPAERKQVERLLRPAEVRLSVASWRLPPNLSFVGRAFIVQGLRSLRLSPQVFQEQHGSDSERVLTLLLGALTAEAGCRTEGVGGLPAAAAPGIPESPRARIIPFYLPQFHPTPENDEWWGRGFTEWTNVTGAIPVYRGHQQPKLPEDLAFYDLRLDTVREQQAALASEHGVEGFMYYHYWFAGRQILETPIESLVRNPGIEQPFCLMWANENWTRSWDGGHDLVLLAQDYDAVPAKDFITHALTYMKDPRYLRVGGRAVLSVYRPGSIPNFAAVIATWHERAAAEGIDLYIIAVSGLLGRDGVAASTTTAELGLDGSMDFPPHLYSYVGAPDDVQWDPRWQGGLFSYSALVAEDVARLAGGLADTHYPTVMPSWDNTARRQWNAHLWVEANPYTFRRWLVAAVMAVAARPAEHRMVFVNAWNEWAEGAVLEPSVQYGRTYLQAIRDVAL